MADSGDTRRRPPSTGNSFEVALTAATVPTAIAPAPPRRGCWISIVASTSLGFLAGASDVADPTASYYPFAAGQVHEFFFAEGLTHFKVRPENTGRMTWWVSSG